jgi:hypothetical protein
MRFYGIGLDPIQCEREREGRREKPVKKWRKKKKVKAT